MGNEASGELVRIALMRDCDFHHIWSAGSSRLLAGDICTGVWLDAGAINLRRYREWRRQDDLSTIISKLRRNFPK